MNLITALEIQTNGEGIVCDSAGPDKNKKYAGWISLYRDGILHKHLLSSEHIYSSGRKAISEMKGIVEKVREIDLAAV